MISRRGLLIAAPAVVAAGALMPVSARHLTVDGVLSAGDRITFKHLIDYVGESRTAGVDVLYGMLKTNRELTVNMITKEAIELFRNSNAFIKGLDAQYLETGIIETKFDADEDIRLRVIPPEDYVLTATEIRARQRLEPIDMNEEFVRVREFYEGPQWTNEEKRTLIPRQAATFKGLEFYPVRESEAPQQVARRAAVAAPVAIAVGAAAVIAKNPVVSRRFWGK